MAATPAADINKWTFDAVNIPDLSLQVQSAFFLLHCLLRIACRQTKGQVSRLFPHTAAGTISKDSGGSMSYRGAIGYVLMFHGRNNGKKLMAVRISTCL